MRRSDLTNYFHPYVYRDVINQVNHFKFDTSKIIETIIEWTMISNCLFGADFANGINRICPLLINMKKICLRHTLLPYVSNKYGARLCKLPKKGALDSQLQVIKFTSCLPMVGDSLRVLWLPPPLKLVAVI